MSEPEVDRDRAVEIATERLAESLMSIQESNTSNVAKLTHKTTAIRRALLEGEEVTQIELEEAVAAATWVLDDLEDVANLFGWSGREIGLERARSRVGERGASVEADHA